ncbi:MAG: GspE/PulE family protein [Bacilli bacterium]
MKTMLNINKFVNEKIIHQVLAFNLIDNDQLEKITKKYDLNSVKIDDELVQKGYLTEVQMAQVQAAIKGVELSNIDVIAYDDEVVKMVSPDFVRQHSVLPLNKEHENGEEIYIVAIGEILDNNSLNIARTLFGNNAKIFFAVKSKIRAIHDIVYSKSKVNEAINEYHSEETDSQEEINLQGKEISTAPTVKLVESILREAIVSKASDIHIEPYEKEVRVRNRIDGVLYESASFNSNMYSAISTRLKIMSGLNITERRIPQDGRFSITFNNNVYDFRLSTLPIVNGEKIVIRILDNSAFQYSFQQLGLTDEKISVIEKILKEPYGIVLLTGPTGCGKSTTLYSFIRSINKEGINIVSVEDPVEYSIKGINQVQVNNKVNMTFANALRSILRQDPNVIMIGEIRDEETAHIAIRSAITGHLVFSTIHTNDAVGAISRLNDMGVESYLVADALQAIIAQRLVRRLCPECRKKIKTTAVQMKALGLKKAAEIYMPVGCPACHNTGYKGRIGIYELLRVTDELREKIVNKANVEEINEYLNNNQYSRLKDECIKAILRGDTSFSELYTIASEDE